MNFTNQALNLLKHWEAKNGIPNLKAYRDNSKKHIWTIGWGHTGEEVHEGLVWTIEQCQTALDNDLRWAKEMVKHSVHDSPVQLSDNQYSALVIFCYNIGVAGFLGSTALRNIKAGLLAYVPDAIRKWNKTSDESGVLFVDKELTVRREKEIELWSSPSIGV